MKTTTWANSKASDVMGEGVSFFGLSDLVMNDRYIDNMSKFQSIWYDGGGSLLTQLAMFKKFLTEKKIGAWNKAKVVSKRVMMWDSGGPYPKKRKREERKRTDMKDSIWEQFVFPNQKENHLYSHPFFFNINYFLSYSQFHLSSNQFLHRKIYQLAGSLRPATDGGWGCPRNGWDTKKGGGSYPSPNYGPHFPI